MDLNTTVTLRSECYAPVRFGNLLSHRRGSCCVVKVALDNGYRMIDTAQMYGNEEDVGAAISSWCTSNPIKNGPLL